MSDVPTTDLIARARKAEQRAHWYATGEEKLFGALADALENANTTLDYDRDYIKSLEAKIVALEAVTVPAENYQEKMARLWENTTPGKREAAARLAEAARAVGSDSEREALQRTLTNVLSNASNFPSKAIPYLLGQNMGPLNAKVADAVLARGFRLPVPVEQSDKEVLDGLAVAMLGTTDGDLIPNDSEVPAGEMFRLAAEYFVSLTVPLAVPVEPETPERFPESPHVEAKYWAELVRARRRIAESEVEVQQLRSTLARQAIECSNARFDLLNESRVQVDPQPHDSGSCPNGGGYSCTNHEPHDSGQVTEVDE